MRFIVTLILIYLSSALYGQTYYSQSSSDPDILNNWNTNRSGGGSAPSTFLGSNDVFVIQNGHTMTSTNDAGGRTTSGWNIGGSSSTLQIEGGGVLVANYEVDLGSTATFQIDDEGSYIHNFPSDEIFDGTESFAAGSTFEIQSIPSSTLDHNISFGNLIINYTSGGSLRVNNADNETFVVNGNLTIENTGSGTDEFRMATGSGDNVTLDIAGSFILTGGRFDFFSASGGTNGSIDVGGDFLLTGGTWDNSGSNNLTVNFTNDQERSTINFSGFTEAGSVIADTDWNIELGNTLTMLSNWEVGSGEVLTISGQLNFGTFYTDGSGSLTANSGATLGIGASDGINAASTAGNIHFTLANRNISTGCNFTYNGSVAQETGDGLNNIGNLQGNLTISNTTNDVTFTEDLNIADGFELLVDEGATFVMAANNEIITASGTTTATINGTLKTGDISGLSASTGANLQGFSTISLGSNSLIEYNRSGSQTITNQSTYNNLTISNSSASNDFSGTLDVDGDLALTNSSNLELDANTLQLAGNLTIGTGSQLEEGTSTVLLNGSNQVINADGSDVAFYNLTISSSGTVTSNENLELDPNATLTITSGTLDLGSNSLQTTASNRTLVMTDGTLKLGEISASNQPNFGTVTISGGTIELYAAGDQELNGGETYNNITFSGSGTKTISSTTADIDGLVYITESCTLDVENRSFGNSGTDLTMDGGYFKIEGSGTKPDISGNYTLTGGTIEFGGSSSMTIRSPETYNNVVVSGRDVSNSSGNYTLNNGGSFTINSGAKYSATTREITSSGTASLTVNGTFYTEDEQGFSGTNNNESVDENTVSITLGSTSTIEYGRSGAQAVSDRDDYANLTFSGNGAKTMTGTPMVSGSYTLNSGNIIYGTSIEFNGTSTQSIEGDVFGTAQVILSGGGEKDLISDATFGGTVTFTNGVLDLGANDVTIESTATVGSANASSYLKINGTGRVKRTISNGTDYLFPIGENPYLPITVSCAACLNEDISVGVKDVIYSDPEDETTTLASAGHSNYVDKTWELNTDGVGGDVTIELQWNSTDQTTSPGSPNNMAIGYWLDGTSTSWNNGSISAASNASSTYTQDRTLTNPASGKYYLGIGSNSTPLPVQLSEFKYQCNKTGSFLKWQTLTEINNSHFWVEGSTNGIAFYKIEQVLGHGNSLDIIDYHYQIPNDVTYQYYRLRQVDFDGKTEISKVISADCNNDLKLNFQIANKVLLTNTKERLEILDMNGKVLLVSTGQLALNLNHLQPGVYLVKNKNSVNRFVLPN